MTTVPAANAEHQDVSTAEGKVPEVNTSFWLIKILATTLGETAGDAVTMSMNVGYLVGSSIFLSIFLVSVACQVMAKRFHPLVFWSVIVATTTAGTTLADFFDRSLGIGYLGGSTTLFVLLMASLAIWYRSQGSVSIKKSFRAKLKFSTG
jgi:uncharacterized membrane-anchored protein